MPWTANGKSAARAGFPASYLSWGLGRGRCACAAAGPQWARSQSWRAGGRSAADPPILRMCAR
eukprot:1162278-Prymnesium_polylepis.1